MSASSGVEHRAELRLNPGVLDGHDDLDPVIEVARHQVGAAEEVRDPVAASKWKTRLCSRNRPRTDRTLIVSVSSGTPGRSEQMPRAMTSMRAPSCEAA